MAEDLNVITELSANPRDVFAALTSSDGLATWFAEHADVSLDEQRYDFWGRFTFRNPSRGDGGHPITACEPDAHLGYGWRLRDHDTTVSIRIQPRGGRSLVHLTHGLSKADADARWTAPEDFWFLSLDNLRRHLDGRPVVRCDFSRPGKGDIHRAIDIDAPREVVFESLIMPEQLQRWIASNAIVEPRVGGTFDYGWGGGGPVKIVDLVQNERLATQWEGWGEFPDTVTTWTLEGSGGRTRLTLVHSGFAPDQDNGALDIGWMHFLVRIQSLCEYGPSWTPAIKRITEDAYPFYCRAMQDGQRLFPAG